MTTLATISILIFGLFLVRPLLLGAARAGARCSCRSSSCCAPSARSRSRRACSTSTRCWRSASARFFLRRRGYQMAPFVLGLVLGDLLDKSLRRGLVLSDGSLAPFFTRPICAVLAAVTVFTMLLYVPAFNVACAAHGAAPSGCVFAPQRLRQRHEVRALQRGAAAAAVRRSNARSRRRWATTASKSRRSRWPTTRSTITDAQARGFAPHRRRTTASRSAACTGCWSRPRACRSSAPTPRCAQRTIAVMRAPGRAVRAAGRQLPGARLAEAALGAAGRHARDGAGDARASAWPRAGAAPRAHAASPTASSRCRRARPT